MKIIVANKYHFVNGGPERYLLGLTDYLKPLGHDIIPFSIAYDRNLPSDYQDYFLKPIGSGAQSKLYKIEGGLLTKLRIAARAVYSLEARRSLERLIVDTKPDLLYCLNIVNHMSPSVIDAAHKRGIPVVMRISDYNLVCANYIYLRSDEPCMECDQGYYHAVKHRCVYGSAAASLSRVAAMYAQKLIRIYDKVDAFITPSNFMRETLIRNGFPEKKIHHIHTFVNSSVWTPRYDNDGYILYFGRLTPEKGLEFLLRSYVKSKVSDPLHIVGECPDGYMDEVKARVGEENLTNVKFLGFKTGDELREIVRGAKFVIVPSLDFDNCPNAVYESCAAGKPVIASERGGLPEQVSQDTGILVEPGNIEQLADAIIRLSGSAESVKELGRNARKRVEVHHNIETHVDRLLKLFDPLITK